MKAKLKIIIPMIIAITAIILAALCIKFVPDAGGNIESMLTTAQKYLVEMNYEQAIAEFNKIIELDPMNADAYLGLAQAYINIDDNESALETLEKGFEMTGDERLKALLEQLLGEVAHTETSPISGTAENIIYGDSDTTEAYESDDGYITIKGEKYPTNLTELNLSDKELTNEDIKELYKMKDLKSLELAHNKLTDTNAFSKLTNLEILRLADNYITDLSGLKGLDNLVILQLNGNQISDVSPLSGLHSLSRLYLSYNKVSDVSSLKGLAHLKEVALADNGLGDINSLLKLTMLEDLWVDKNPISDDDIKALVTALPDCDIHY